MAAPDAPAEPVIVAMIAERLRAKAFAEAAAVAQAGVEQLPDSAQLWALLAEALLPCGDMLAGYRAATRALELDPNIAGARQNADMALDVLRRPYRTLLSELINPDNEAQRLEAAYQAVVAADDEGLLEPAAEGVSLGLFLRLAALEEADRRWPFAQIGRRLAQRGEHRHLIYQLPRVRDDAERLDLVAQHRAWGERVEAAAAARPVRRAPHSRGGRPRIGLLSSDLRVHAVGAFVDPLIDKAPEAGVDLYGYSAHSGPADGYQQHVAAQCAGFRHLPGADALAMAQAVAADGLDVLIEIGGSTNENRLEALGHRLAPVQISWLGYPHSAGLSTIDAMVLDPYCAPTEPGLLLERPLLMPHSWVAMSPGYFRTDIPLPSALAEDRKGHMTFGSAGSPYKYSALTFEAWGRVLAAVPGSRFLFVRPEGDSPTFRRHVAGRFARHGVDPDRLDFAAVRGGHLPHYGAMDISLDSMPLTGGMTTCEALWMGVPVVTLAGKGIYERLSHSLLTNMGLGELSTLDIEGFVTCAASLAADRERRRQWRAHGRGAIMGGPLGDLGQFARDFFGLVTAGL